MKTVVTIFLGGFAILATGLGLFAYSFAGQCYLVTWPKAGYERNLWLSSAPEGRFHYVRDILANRKFLHLKKDALFAELGEPGYKDREGRYATYVVRYFPEGGCGFNAIAILHFDFDLDGSVIKQFVRFD